MGTQTDKKIQQPSKRTSNLATDASMQWIMFVVCNLCAYSVPTSLDNSTNDLLGLPHTIPIGPCRKKKKKMKKLPLWPIISMPCVARLTRLMSLFHRCSNVLTFTIITILPLLPQLTIVSRSRSLAFQPRTASAESRPSSRSPSISRMLKVPVSRTGSKYASLIRLLRKKSTAWKNSMVQTHSCHSTRNE